MPGLGMYICALRNKLNGAAATAVSLAKTTAAAIGANDLAGVAFGARASLQTANQNHFETAVVKCMSDLRASSHRILKPWQNVMWKTEGNQIQLRTGIISSQWQEWAFHHKGASP